MDINIETITPAIAKAMLERNPENRNIRPGLVADYARDMKAGRWQLNSEAIRLNGDGSLIDGQHRLSACVRANTPFQTVVVRDLPNDVRRTIDGGLKRSLGDRMAMNGIPNANTVASVSRLLCALAWGTSISKIRLTPAEMELFLDKHPGVIASVSKSSHIFRKMGTQLGALHYIGSQLGAADRAAAMVEVWRTGVPDYDGDAMHKLRERLVRTYGTPMAPPGGVLSRLFCGAWRSFAESRPVELLKPRDKPVVDGWAPELLGVPTVVPRGT